MANAAGGSVPSGVGYGEGVPSQPTKRSTGERRELPQRGPGKRPGRKSDFGVFCRPQNAPFCTYVTESEGGGESEGGDNLH